MKNRILILSIFAACFGRYAAAQTAGTTDIGVGYFNDHQFATYGTISGSPPVLTGDLAGNAFSIAFSGNTRTVLTVIANYGPARPTNSGTFSAPFVELNYSSVPATSTVTFTNLLEPLDQMHAVDIENNESVTFEFLDATNTPVTIAGNIKVVSVSTITPTASLNYPNSTTIGINTAPGKTTSTNNDQGFSFIMLTNVVKSIRFIQTAASTGGSWDFTFTKGTPDRGDAPTSYGNATHISLAARLKLGANGGDAEGSAFGGINANGDDAVSGATIIDDEDGTATVPTVTNTGVLGQIISTYSISTRVTNSTGASANVMAWADWNGNGVFDASEAQTATAVVTGSTNTSRTFTWTNFALGGPGRGGTYLRVRTTTSALTSANSTGLFANGEVEDYFIPFAVTLPITLKSFNARVIEKHYTLLEWETENEQNNTGFQVEHSVEGLNWKEIGFVPTAAPSGNSVSALKYQFTHESSIPGTKNYYRLRQIDLDGKFSYSNIRTVNIPGSRKNIIVYPNPVNNVATIYGVKEGDLISLYNTNGKLIDSKTANNSQVRFDVGNYSAGVYTIQVRRQSEEIQSFKILKQ